MKGRDELYKLLTIVGIGLIGYKLIGTKDDDKRTIVSKKSDCSIYFLKFNQRISINSQRVENLKSAHKAIRRKVRDYFERYTDVPKPEFFIQGSYKMKTLIEPPDLKCDVDLGVYFKEKPKVSFVTLQRYLKEALDNHTSLGIELKQNCVRLNYVFDFHIDLPIYYLGRNVETIYFGSRNADWVHSDPRKFIEWFKAKTIGKSRLVRIIRYFKAWSSYIKYKKAKKMLSGLALTLLVIRFYKDTSRDDVAFCKTALSIYKYLKETPVDNWLIKMPVSPYDNVIDRLTYSQRNSFLDEFKEMTIIASEAITSTNSRTAQMKWRKIFGQQFEL